jgi:hypothetical protein
VGVEDFGEEEHCIWWKERRKREENDFGFPVDQKIFVV